MVYLSASFYFPVQDHFVMLCSSRGICRGPCKAPNDALFLCAFRYYIILHVYIYTHIFPIPTWFMIQVERIQTVRLRLLGLHLRYRISGAEGVAGSCYLAERRWFLKHLRDVPARLIPGPQGPRANPKLRKNCDYLDDFGRLFTRILHIFPEHIHFRWSVSEYLQIEAIPESVVRPCSPRKVIFAAQKDVT